MASEGEFFSLLERKDIEQKFFDGKMIAEKVRSLEVFDIIISPIGVILINFNYCRPNMHFITIEYPNFRGEEYFHCLYDACEIGVSSFKDVFLISNPVKNCLEMSAPARTQRPTASSRRSGCRTVAASMRLLVRSTRQGGTLHDIFVDVRGPRPLGSAFWDPAGPVDWLPHRGEILFRERARGCRRAPIDGSTVRAEVDQARRFAL